MGKSEKCKFEECSQYEKSLSHFYLIVPNFPSFPFWIIIVATFLPSIGIITQQHLRADGRFRTPHSGQQQKSWKAKVWKLGQSVSNAFIFRWIIFLLYHLAHNYDNLCDIESLSSRVSVAIRAAIRKKVKTVSTYNKS